MDVRDHVGRALHGHARQPRRDDGDPRDPPRPRTPASSGLEWTVNAYTLTFAVLLLTGRRARRPVRPAAHVRDRDRRSSPLASAAAALAPSIGALDVARALQGLGGAIVMPLTLTILSAARARRAARRRARRVGRHQRPRGRVRPARRRRRRQRHLLALDLLAQRPDRPRARAARAAAARRDAAARSGASTCPGSGSSSAGLFGIVWGLVRGNSRRLGARRRSSAPLVAGVVLVAAFVAWELRTPQPMLPMRFFRNRTFALANIASLLMCFGMFGSIFLLAQFFQTVQGYSPLRLRPAHPAVDGDADDRGADRRRALRPHRRPAG